MNNAEQNAILDAYLDLKGFLEADDDFALAQLREGAKVSLRELETQFSFLLGESK
jgi:hypothetical protein